MSVPASSSHAGPCAVVWIGSLLAALAGSGAPRSQEPQFGDDLVCRHLVPAGSYAVALADLDGDGDLDLAQARGGRVRPGAFVRFNDGEGTFSIETVLWSAGGGVEVLAVAVADVDGDGDADLVFGVHQVAGAQNRLFINDGSGRFADETAARLPARADATRAVAFADVDGDRDLDLIVGNAAFPGEQNRLLLNDGAGRFADVTVTHLPAFAEGTTGIACEDVDADGDFDLVFANGEWSPSARPAVRLCLNDGTGRFADVTAARLPAHTGETPAAALSDLDADGDLDLVVACTGSEFAAVTQNLIWINDGTGTFADESAARLPSPRDDTRCLAVADYDADGDQDLVFGNQPFQNLRDLDGRDTLFLNDGSGRFVDASDRLPALFDTRMALAVGDVDGDGRLDLVAANLEQDQLLLGRGSARFVSASGSAVRLPGFASSIDHGDLDGDGDLDVAVGVHAPCTSVLLRNDGIGGLEPVSGIDLRDGRPSLGDVDGDGDLDVALASDDQNRLFLNEAGTWLDVTVTHLPSDVRPTRRIVLVDVDGDADLDMVLANGDAACCPERDQLYRNDGSGRFTIAPAAEFPSRLERTRDIDVGDVDSDGDIDVVTATYDQELRLLENDGTGRFADRSAVLPFGGWTVRLADFDGDGQIDLIAGEPGALSLALQDPGGGFRDVTATHLPPGSPYVPIVVAGDVDEDGDRDLVVQDEWYPRLYENDGTGRFVVAPDRITASARFPTWGSTLVPMGLVDLDGDGDVELLRGDTASSGPSALAIHHNRQRHISHARVARTGMRWDFEVWSRPGYGLLFEVAVPLIARGRRQVALPPFGTLQLDPASMVGLDPLYVPPRIGRAAQTITIPNEAGLVGQEVFTQALLVSPAEGARFTNAVGVRIVH